MNPAAIVRIPLWSHGVWRQPYLAQLLERPVRIGVLPLHGRDWAGWGMKPSGRRARWYAARSQASCLRLEDGFLRSVGPGRGSAALSLVVDDAGIYYDSTRPSTLETLLASEVDLLDGIAADVARAKALVLAHHLSKYNHAPLLAPDALRAGDRRRVLVIDQTFGDLGVVLGGAGEASFADMLAAARAENPDATIYVKTHPEVAAGSKRGYLTAVQDDERTVVLRQPVNPLSLIERMDRVYTVTSTMGFEALLAGKPVAVFGLPWYAGWGASDDRQACARRLPHAGRRRTVDELFAAAYFHYARYLDPATQRRGTIFDVIDWLVRNKAANDAARGDLYCVGMTMWKRAIVRPFLAGPSCRVHFVGSVAALEARPLPADSRIVIWGVKDEARASMLAAARKLPLWRMEDGFLRSVGLGSDLFRPVSLVLDQSGMYYDPASGSALETMLATQRLDGAQLERAGRFRAAYVAMRMSKYNLGRTALRVDARGRKVLLVPGQVEDDASIRRGSPVVRTNLALLQAVRAANPDAFILYKAHPDVVAGNRRGAIGLHDLRALADQCVNEANIIDCIRAADEVHTMTSLSGFEALLHGRSVHCYGGPFYAGWGLTTDHFDLPARQRHVSLDALVFAVMLHYPRYVLPRVPGFVSAEQVMASLVEQAARPAAAHGAGWLARKWRKAQALAQLLRAELDWPAA